MSLDHGRKELEFFYLDVFSERTEKKDETRYPTISLTSLNADIEFFFFFKSLSIQEGLAKWNVVNKRDGITPDELSQRTDAFAFGGGRLNSRSSHVKVAI